MNNKGDFPKPPVSDLFLSVVMGQFVEVIADLPTGENGVGVPFRTNAYFIDADNDFFYLGDNPFEPTLLIQRPLLKLISLVPEGPTSEEEQILADMGVPTSEEEVN